MAFAATLMAMLQPVFDRMAIACAATAPTAAARITAVYFVSATTTFWSGERRST